MFTWNLYYRYTKGSCIGTIKADTKDEAEAKAFELYNRPVDVDLDRKEYYERMERV